MNEERLLGIIQNIALNAVRAGNPCDYCIGTVLPARCPSSSISRKRRCRRIFSS